MSTDLTLYGIEVELARIGEEVLAALDSGDTPDEGLLMQLAEWTAMERGKADAAAAFMLSLKADAERCEDLARRQRERADRLSSARKRLDQYVIQVLGSAGRDKVRGTHHTLRVCDSPLRMEVEDESELPLDVMHQPPPVPDKDEIRRRLAAGQDVPGARLVRGKHLRIDT